jgi:DNA-binding NarL/FixJ family response regulator
MVNPSDIVSVVITDDHPMLREGLRSILRLHPHITVLGDYGSGEQLLQGLTQKLPEILLLDLQLPDINGGELASKLRKKYPDLKIIILTGNNSVYSARLLLDIGVHGYLLKNSEQHLLIDAINHVQRGYTYISPELQQRLFRMSKQMSNEQINAADLTARELEVLKLIAAEFTSHEIADKLRISHRTVEHHRVAIMHKLGTKNMIGMVKKGILLGLVE